MTRATTPTLCSDFTVTSMISSVSGAASGPEQELVALGSVGVFIASTGASNQQEGVVLGQGRVSQRGMLTGNGAIK